MTPQSWLGCIMVLIGYSVRLAAAVGWIHGDVGFMTELTAGGAAILGKELWPGSPQSFAVKARASKFPPPIAIVLLCLCALPACAGYEHAPDDARAAASRMREDLAEVSGLLAGADSASQLLCVVRANTPECSVASDTLRVLRAAHKSASLAVDTLEVSGIAADGVLAQVHTVLEQARALGETLRALAGEVEHAVATQADRSPSGPSGPSAEQPSATEAQGPAANPTP